MKPLHPFSALRGVTLTEVMIVIAIIGILAGIAVPSYTDMINRNKVKQAAESLADDLKYARTEAIKRSCDVSLSFSSATNTYQIATIANSGSCVATTTLKSVAIDPNTASQFPGVTFSTTQTARFDFRRGTTAAANIATATKGGLTATVRTDIAGKVFVCSDTISGYVRCT